jgi:GNAT superfamily N-acetyltransferase
MQPFDYLHLQMKLEGKGLNRDGLLTSLRPSSEVLPLVLVARTSDGHCLAYLSEMLPLELRRDLAIRTTQLEFPKLEVVLDTIRSYGIHPKVGHYRTYIFPDHAAQVEATIAKCFPKDDPKVKDFGFNGFADAVYAIEDGVQIVSACVSVLENNECAEAWVLTAPQHRRKGLARMTVAAWAKAVREQGRVPFYSHKIANVASANLAGKLELIPVFEEIGIEPPN